MLCITRTGSTFESVPALDTYKEYRWGPLNALVETLTVNSRSEAPGFGEYGVPSRNTMEDELSPLPMMVSFMLPAAAAAVVSVEGTKISPAGPQTSEEDRDAQSVWTSRICGALKPPRGTIVTLFPA